MKYIDDPKLLDLRFSNGMLILPYFYGRIMAKLNNQTYSSDGIERPPLWESRLSRLKGISKAWPRRADILTLTTTRWESKENGSWRNIQHGYYYDLFPNSFLMLEDPDAYYRWKTLKTREPMCTIKPFVDMMARTCGKFYNILHPVHREDFKIFHEFYPFIRIKDLEIADNTVRFQHIIWRILLKMIKPKMILMHSGSYGRTPGIICKTAHELGIVTVDTQHGQVYQHKVYSASDTIKKSSEYMEYMPDFFYSFGKYWSNCVDWEYKKIEVGNPHLNEYVKKFSNVKVTHDMLVISQPTEKEQQHDFVKRLASVFPDKEIRVRLHPFETLDTEKAVYSNCPNVVVTDSSVNLYEDMCSSEKVIGWCSTCLSELLAFGKTPIIVNSSLAKTFPRDLGVWINAPEDILSITNELEGNVDYSQYWYQDFEKSVKSHIAHLIN